MEEQHNILERIHAAYYHQTASERKVSDFVLKNHSQVQFMSITQLADECGVAEATVSRFCRNLQLKGFNAFKIELAKHSGAGQPSGHDPDAPQGRWARSAALSVDAIQQTLSLLDPVQVERAVAMLEAAPRCLCMGSGGSMIIASECAHMFSTVTGKFTPISGSHNQMSAAATATPGDVILLFSYSGATTGGIQVLEYAKDKGIPTILVTHFHKSPAARLADVVLRCGSNEGPFQFGSVPAKVAQLTIIDVLFQEYRLRNPEECEEHIQRIAAALSGMHV